MPAGTVVVVVAVFVALASAVCWTLGRRRGKKQNTPFDRDLTRLSDAAEFANKIIENSPYGILVVDQNLKIVMVNETYCRMTGRDREEFIGKTPPFPGWAPEMREQIEEYVRSVLEGEIDAFEIPVVRKDGSRFPALFSLGRMRTHEGKGYFLGNIKDLTREKKADAALRESEASFRTAIESLPFQFFMLDRNGRYIMQNQVIKDQIGDIVGKRPEDVATDAETLAKWRDNNRRAFAGETVKGEISFPVDGEERIFHNIVSPVYSRNEVWAIMGINIDITRLVETEKSLRALAGRLHEVREEESTSIAREIHDELGQSLTGLRWDLSRLGKQLNDNINTIDPTQFKLKIGEMTRHVDTLLRRVRDITTQLRPPILDDLGLVGAIEWQTEVFEKRTGIHCEISKKGVDDSGIKLDIPRSTAAFRIYQEILTNIGRHAQANRVEIVLRNEDGVFSVEVRDNGKGIPADDPKLREGLGILGMRERALVFGGEVTIRSAGRGTTVSVVIPHENAP